MTGFLSSAPLYILAFLFVLSLVVTVHELGHFWAARACGVAIDRFSIGFGKALVSWRDRTGVLWTVGWIPLGGYVRFSGDENAASVPDQNDLESLRAEIVAREGEAATGRYFQFKPLWQRAFVTAAGPAANFLLAIALFAALVMAFGQPIYEAKIRISSPGGPAEVAGLRNGDVIRRLDQLPIQGFEDLQNYIRLRANTPIRVEVRRGSEDLTFTATPVQQEIVDRIGGRMKVGMLGIGIDASAKVERQRYGPIAAIRYGVDQTWDVLSTTIFYLGRVITGKMPADQIGSLLGIANTAGKVAQAGAEGAPNVPMQVVGSFVSLLGLAAFLSVSVGFMNLLPVPVLDGGHLLFYAYEAVARRPLPARIQAVGYRLGLALLVGFMLFATWNDLQRLRVFNFLGGLFS
jgi:regulator of sigma E protease